MKTKEILRREAGQRQERRSRMTRVSFYERLVLVVLIRVFSKTLIVTGVLGILVLFPFLFTHCSLSTSVLGLLGAAGAMSAIGGSLMLWAVSGAERRLVEEEKFNKELGNLLEEE